MKIEYKGKVTEEREKQQIWEILCECDQEFYPPLSARNSSAQKNLKNDTAGEEDNVNGQPPTVYYDEMIRQEFILAYADD